MKTPICLIALVLGMACSTADRKGEENLVQEDKIRINQVGYYTSGPKVFIVLDSGEDRFELLDESGEVAYSGNLSEAVFWESSGEYVRKGNFSDFTSQGTYRIHIDGTGESHSFDIGASIYAEAADAALKSNYFQRCSMPIGESYGGKFARPAGHPDINCLYHPSTGYETGGKASPGGWYDAGDYGKYIVNAGISVGTMLLLQEIYPDSYGDEKLKIPESGNGIDDMMDEILYETDWMFTMQDTDGGVFHKLTTLKFTGFVMPHETTEQRYFIGKSTAAALNFAAVMAMMSRLHAAKDPAYGEKCLEAAEKAWDWAVENPEVYFRNPSDVSTGAYGDAELQEEFFWAAAELYNTTGKDEYYQHLEGKFDGLTFRIEESWRNYQDNLGYYSLLHPSSPLPDDKKEIISARLITLADSLTKVVENHPYRIPINHFVWGSNSDVLNLAMVFAIAHRYTGDQKYLDMAVETVDYIFGKNATSYSFLTGVGDKVPMNIHHRPSGADGIDEPVPGFVVGGPNGRFQDARDVERSGYSYPYEEPARAYIDVEASYASNEICLNWNAPLVFMLRYLEENL